MPIHDSTSSAYEQEYRNLKEMAEREYECPVCLKKLAERCNFRVMLKCKHVICAVCNCTLLEDALKTNLSQLRFGAPTCPLCRKKYKKTAELDFGSVKRVTELDLKKKIADLEAEEGECADCDDESSVDLELSDSDDDYVATGLAARAILPTN